MFDFIAFECATDLDVQYHSNVLQHPHARQAHVLSVNYMSFRVCSNMCAIGKSTTKWFTGKCVYFNLFCYSLHAFATAVEIYISIDKKKFAVDHQSILYVQLL